MRMRRSRWGWGYSGQARRCQRGAMRCERRCSLITTSIECAGGKAAKRTQGLRCFLADAQRDDRAAILDNGTHTGTVRGL